VILGLAAGGLANFLLLYYVQPLLPSLAVQFAVTPSTSAAALSISTLTLAIALLVVGPASDALGRVALMRLSLTASGVLGVASAFAPSWHALLVLRGLEGIALAALPAVALAYVREEIHPSAHLQANAAYITGTALGGAAARLLPGPLADWWGWSGATLVVSAFTLLCAMATFLLLPASARFTPSVVRPGTLLRTTVRTVRDPVLAGLCVIGLATMGTFVGIYNAISFRLQDAPYLLGGEAGAVYLAYLAGIAAPWLIRRVASARGRDVALLLTVGLLAAGTTILSFRPLPLVMAGLGLLTFAFLGAHSVASGWVVDRARHLGIGAAQATSSYLVAYYTGSALFGALVTRQWQLGGWTGVTVYALSLAVLAATATVWIGRHDRRASAVRP